MTAEKLHDALNLLPADLITATDQLRTAPRAKIIPWKRILPVAACFVLLMGMGLLIRREMLLSHIVKQAPAEAPAAMAPVPESKITADAAAQEEPAADAPVAGIPAEEAVPEPPSDIDAPEIPHEEAGGSGNGMEEELFIDHSHRFAEETETAGSTAAYCGNMITTVCLNGETYRFGGSDSVALTHILKNLPYTEAEVCRCMAEFTVDTESLSGIQVNLTEAFARYENGQAALTEAQVQTIREIIGKLQ